MGKYTQKELDYLSLGGLNNDDWPDEEKKDYLDSLCQAEKDELDLYDVDAGCCKNCVDGADSGTIVSSVMTKQFKKCRNCGHMVE